MCSGVFLRAFFFDQSVPQRDTSMQVGSTSAARVWLGLFKMMMSKGHLVIAFLRVEDSRNGQIVQVCTVELAEEGLGAKLIY